MDSPQASDSGLHPLSRPVRAPFVGRAKELTYVTERIEAAARGEGGIVLLSGEPGVGKTALMLEVAADAEARGWRVLTGHAYDSQGMPPYLPFVEALQGYVQLCPLEDLQAHLGDGAPEVALMLPDVRRRLPGLPASAQLDPQSAAYRLGESIFEFLGGIARASPPGLLLCLDDLHWADDSTLLLLEHLTRQPAGQPIFIVATYRDTELEVTRPLARTLEQLARQPLSNRLDVKRLSQEEVGAMLEALGRPGPPASLIEAIYNETEGNHFFARELFTYLAAEGRLFDDTGRWRAGIEIGDADLPQSVRLTIGRRLERLSEQCRRVLSFAAVIGRTFSFELLRAVVDLEDEALLDALDEAERAHVLASDPRGLTFAHELVRQTLLAGLSLPRRQRLHLRAGEALEVQYAGQLDQHAAALAEHFAQSTLRKDLAKASVYGELASRQAMSVYAYSEAAVHLRRCLELQEVLDPGDKTRQIELLLAFGACAGPAGNERQVVDEVVPAAIRLAEDMENFGAAFRACELGLRTLRRLHGPSAGSSAVFRDWAEKANLYAKSAQERVSASVEKSFVLLAEERYHDTWKLLMAALADARLAGGGESFFQVTRYLLIQPWPLGEEQGRLELAREASTRPATNVRLLTLSNALRSCAGIYLEYDDRRQADALWARAKEMAELSRDVAALHGQRVAEVMVATLDGRLDEAVAEAERLAAESAALRARAGGGGLARVAVVALHFLGRPEAALSVLEQQEPLEGRRVINDFTRAVMLAHADRSEEARSLIQATLTRLGGSGAATTALDLAARLDVALILADLDECKFASRELKKFSSSLVRYPPQSESPLGAACVPRLLGAAASLLGNPDEARAYFEEAIKFCASIRFRPELALARLDLAELLLRHFPAERVAALQHLEVAIVEFEAMSMQPSLERAQRLRGRRRSSVQPREPLHPDGLSGREVEILGLIAAGKSNQQIADALVLSIRTVERHINHIYAKTGVHTKAQATAYALHQGIG